MSGARHYRELLGLPHARAMLGWSLLGRLPLGMTPLALLFLVRGGGVELRRRGCRRRAVLRGRGRRGRPGRGPPGRPVRPDAGAPHAGGRLRALRVASSSRSRCSTRASCRSPVSPRSPGSRCPRSRRRCASSGRASRPTSCARPPTRSRPPCRRCSSSAARCSRPRSPPSSPAAGVAGGRGREPRRRDGDGAPAAGARDTAVADGRRGPARRARRPLASARSSSTRRPSGWGSARSSSRCRRSPRRTDRASSVGSRSPRSRAGASSAASWPECARRGACCGASWLGSFALAARLARAAARRLDPTLCVLAFVAGLPIAPTIGALYSLIDRSARTGTAAEAFAWFGTAVSIGIAAGSVLAGVLVDERGVRAAFAAGAAVAFCGALLRLGTTRDAARRPRSGRPSRSLPCSPSARSSGDRAADF